MRYHGLTPVAVDYHCFAVDEFAFANRRETPDELPIAYSSHRMMTMAAENHCFAVDTFAFVNHAKRQMSFPLLIHLTEEPGCRMPLLRS